MGLSSLFLGSTCSEAAGGLVSKQGGGRAEGFTVSRRLCLLLGWPGHTFSLIILTEGLGGVSILQPGEGGSEMVRLRLVTEVTMSCASRDHMAHAGWRAGWASDSV